jgi:hypothetical protein
MAIGFCARARARDGLRRCKRANASGRVRRIFVQYETVSIRLGDKLHEGIVPTGQGSSRPY